MVIFTGVGVNKDNAIGKALKYGASCKILDSKQEAIDVFIDKFHHVREKAIEQIEALYDKLIQIDEEEAEIFLSHQLLLKDESLIKAVEDNIKSGFCLIEALDKTMNHFIDMFRSLDGEIFISKSNDIMDIFTRMKDITKGINLPIKTPSDDFILCCENLLPSYLYKFDNRLLKGIVVKNGSVASHGVILAKKKNIPVVINVREYEKICDNDKILINGSTGKIIFINKN